MSMKLADKDKDELKEIMMSHVPIWYDKWKGVVIHLNGSLVILSVWCARQHMFLFACSSYTLYLISLFQINRIKRRPRAFRWFKRIVLVNVIAILLRIGYEVMQYEPIPLVIKI